MTAVETCVLHNDSKGYTSGQSCDRADPTAFAFACCKSSLERYQSCDQGSGAVGVVRSAMPREA